MTINNRLTTLERVRDWVGVTGNNDDLLLNRLIEETSRFILSYIQRPTLFQYIFSDVYDGMGQKSMMLRHYPVQSVSLVMIDNVMVPASTSVGMSGYVLENWEGLPPGRPQLLSLRGGYAFTRGFSNINIVYTTGYTVTNEAQTIPASGNYTLAVNAPNGVFGADNGVIFSNGTALVNVPSNPVHGQYSINHGIYSFASADGGAGVQINYSYIPADIEQACMVLVGERYRYKNRIGEISKTLGGQETISFSQKEMPDFVKTILQPYRRLVLV